MRTLRDALAARGTHPARTVVLLPYAQLMPVARQFWAALAPTGFAPRFETTMNWARRRPWEPGELDLSFDIARDLLTARGWLEQGACAARPMPWRDCSWTPPGRPPTPRVPCRRSAAPPGRRSCARLLQGMEAPALATEAAIARIAFEWVAASGLPPTRCSTAPSAPMWTCWSCCRASRRKPSPLPWPDSWATARSPGRCRRQSPRRDRPACLRGCDRGSRARRCLRAAAPAAGAGAGGAGGHRSRAHPPHRRAAVHARRARARRDRLEALDHPAAAHVMTALRACAWDAPSDQVLDWLKNVPALGSGLVQGLERRVRRRRSASGACCAMGDWGESASLQEAARTVAGWRETLQTTRDAAGLDHRHPRAAAAMRPVGRCCAPTPRASRPSMRCGSILEAAGEWSAWPQAHGA